MRIKKTTTKAPKKSRSPRSTWQLNFWSWQGVQGSMPKISFLLGSNSRSNSCSARRKKMPQGAPKQIPSVRSVVLAVRKVELCKVRILILRIRHSFLLPKKKGTFPSSHLLTVHSPILKLLRAQSLLAPRARSI